MTYTTIAIILRRRDHGEWDRLYTVYARERGKLTLIGKGTRRPKAKLASHLEPYAEVDLTIANGKTIDRITFARTLETSSALAASWERIQLAAFVCECVDALVGERHRDFATYDLLRDAIHTTRDTPTDQLINRSIPTLGSGFRHREAIVGTDQLRTPFIIHLLSLLGYAPQLDHCIECRIALLTGPVIGVPLRGGIACSSCAVSGSDGIPLSEEARQQLADAVASFRPFTVNPAVATFAQTMLEAHLWQPLRTLLPGSELTRERDQVRIAAS